MIATIDDFKSMEEINLKFTTIKTQLPDFIHEGLKSYSSNANTYKPQPEELRKKISQKFDIPVERVYLSAGIDESIRLFAQNFGKNTYVFTPTYVEYQTVDLYNGKLNQIYSIKNDQYNIDTSKKDDVTLIYLANPNNPSGITTKEKIIELAENNSNAIVVIDEAYGEFAKLSVIQEVSKYNNLAVMRSFSKDYGMAGNRIGFVIAHPEVIEKLLSKAQWCNVSYLAVGAAMTALDNENYFSDLRDEINKRRDDFRKFLLGAGFRVLPSGINAVLIKFDNDDQGKKFNSYLNKNNIIVSTGNGESNIGLNDSFVRISIGTEDQMSKVTEVIKSYSV